MEELPTFISNFRGAGKINRLCFIAERKPACRVEALKLAALEIRLNTLNFEQLCSIDKELYENGRISSLEHAENEVWIIKTQAIVKETSSRLTHELESYRSNLIKESIRMGYWDLAEFYLKCGNINEAVNNFNKTREYSTTASHIIDLNLKLLKIAVQNGDFSNISGYVLRAENTPLLKETDKISLKSKLSFYSAILDMHEGNYLEAGMKFRSIDFSIASHLDDVTSPSDIIIYTVLCIVSSTSSRAQVKQILLDNSLSSYFDLVPWLKQFLVSFTCCKYADALSILNANKHDLALDILIHTHVDQLLVSIFRRALAFYAYPYDRMCLKTLSEKFSIHIDQIEVEIMALILSGDIQGRIDTVDGVLVREKEYEDEKSSVDAVAEEFVKDVDLFSLRMQLVECGLKSSA